MKWVNNNQRFKITRNLVDRAIYYSKEKGILTSSKIDDLKVRLNPQLDKKAIDLFLTLRYIPAPYTTYRGIKKLPVFHTLEIEPGRIKIKEEQANYQKKEFSYKQITNELRKALFEHVSGEVKDEEKVALFLSGGIDSSSILAILSRLNVKVHTYTLGFNDKDPDLLASRRLARHFSTKHREIVLRDFPKEIFEEVILKMDEPVADPTFLPTKVLVNSLDEDLNKVFIGEGGDEVFGGYPEFRYIELAKFVRHLPRFLQIFAYLFEEKEKKKRIGNFLLDYYNYSKAFLSLKSVFTLDEKEQLYSKEFKKGLDVEKGEIFSFNSQLRFSQNIINFYLKSQLPARLISKYPQNSKYRFCFPMLYNKIVPLMIKAPIKYKFDYFWGKDKKILREVMKDLLPSFVLNRKKRSFTVPIDQWMKGSLKKEIEKTLNKEDIKDSGRFQWDFVSSIIYSRDKSFYWRNKLWSLFVLEKWLAMHYKGNR